MSSFRVKEGDVIKPRDRSLKLDVIATSLLGISLIRPDWIDFNNETLTAKVAALPAPGSVPFPVDVSSVIEYYAQRL